MILNRALRPNVFAQHLVNSKMKRKRTRRHMVAGLMLTSMVDMFSLLVIFLLQSFSNSPEVMAMSKNLVLPAAISAAAPIDAPVLTLSKTEVLLDQKLLGTNRSVADQPVALVKQLDALKQGWVKAHPGAAFSGDVHLQADRDLSSAFVSRFVNILNSQGYSNVHLAVVSGGGQ